MSYVKLFSLNRWTIGFYVIKKSGHNLIAKLVSLECGDIDYKPIFHLHNDKEHPQIDISRMKRIIRISLTRELSYQGQVNVLPTL